MENVDARPLANRSRDGMVIDIELATQRLGHLVYIRRRHRYDDVDVERGTRLPAERAGQRPAHQIAHTARVEDLRHAQRDRDGIVHNAPRRSVSSAASG